MRQSRQLRPSTSGEAAQPLRDNLAAFTSGRLQNNSPSIWDKTKNVANGWFVLIFWFSFSLLASWLGFSASWLLGFLASRLLGFSVSCWFMRLFGFGFSHPLHSQFISGSLVALSFRMLCFPSSKGGLFSFCTLSLVFGFGCPHPQHQQFLSSKCFF